MFSHDNYSIFMFTMRLGSQGVPIYFECFKGSDNTNAFCLDTLKKGVKAVDNLFKKLNLDLDLIFLADRWFCSTELLDYIDSLGHTYCVRLKGNIHVYQNDIKVKAKKLKHYKHRAAVHRDVYILTNILKQISFILTQLILLLFGLLLPIKILNMLSKIIVIVLVQ